MSKKKSKFKKVTPKWLRFQDMNTVIVVSNLIDTELCNSMYADSNINPKYNKSLKKAMKHLAKAYQLVGNKENEVFKKIKIPTY